MDTGTKNRHLGYKISRIREIKGMKQETLAEELGISQQSVSNLENSEFIEEERLQKVADALGVTREGIENFSEEAVLNIIGNTYHVDNSSAVNYACTINPIEKLIEAFEENKRLYERLLAAQKELLQIEKEKNESFRKD